jgi:isopentenyl-diphosphate delta-isomerase
VTLLHDALPELDHGSLSLSTRLLGRNLRAPLLITGMTGGVGTARDVNRRLAATAEEFGIGFGVGSQRPMLRDRATRDSYQVRDVAPSTLILGNIGAVQAVATSTAELEDLVGTIGADALCVHLNPGQEMIQDQGDRDFRGCLQRIAELQRELTVPVVAKETGCGLSPRVLDRLKASGIRTVDVAGAGGTTWVGVETHRASERRARIGQALWDWGIPTAASVRFAANRSLETIASGGIRDGYDVARAIALGATVGGAALPYLRSVWENPAGGGRVVVESMLDTLRTVMLLTGSADLAALRQVPRVYGPALERWLALDR